jgi:16S rRNA G966 N2-methylase RsmD
VTLFSSARFAAHDEGHVTEVATVVPDEPAGEKAAGDEIGVADKQSNGLRFHFRCQPWDAVLDWLVKETGLSLQGDTPPPGTFNFADDCRYTTEEAIDVINGALLTSGYSLVRRGHVLTLINLNHEMPPYPTTATPARELDEGGASTRIAHWESAEDLPTRIALFEAVFWDPRDTVSLRQRIGDTSLFKGKTVLEIGTGSGLLALCCLQAGASRVTATDVNRSALENAAYNAARLGVGSRLDLRLVSLDDPGAYSVVGASEKFDVVISNPPWEDALPTGIEEYAFYDKGFQLMRSLLCGLKDHLEPGGKALLAYGCVDAIRNAKRLADQYEVQLVLVDDRDLERLPDVFLPGMLLELTPR